MLLIGPTDNPLAGISILPLATIYIQYAANVLPQDLVEVISCPG